MLSVQVRRPGGGESDAAFTPSPPVATQASTEQISGFKVSQQTRLRNLCTSMAETKLEPSTQQRSPDSSSSTGSTPDWDNNGHTTILRRLPPVPPISRKPPPPPLYNQLTEDFNLLTSRPQDLLLNRINSKHIPRNTVEKHSSNIYAESHSSSRLLYFSEQEQVPNSNEANTVSSGIQDQIRATQLTRLNRDLTPTISEVYHERNIGLGLAPPLTKLLLPQGEKTDLTESHKEKPWFSTAELQRFYPSEMVEEGKCRNTSPCSELSRRDEGDGRSIADSQYSTGSYNRNPRPSSNNDFDDNFTKDEKQDEKLVNKVQKANQDLRNTSLC